MKKALVSSLAQAGLCENEVSLYMHLLQLRCASLLELKQKTRLSHATVYRTIQKLVEQGLVQVVPVNKKQSLYKPLSLKALVEKLQSAQRKLRKLELSLNHLESLLPYMECGSNLLESTADESIEVMEGLDAFQEEYLKIPERADSEFLAIGSSDAFWKASNASFESPLERSFVSRRLKNNMYSRSMMIATEDSEKIAKNDEKEKRTTKLKSSLPVVSNMLMMCGDTVSHFVCDAKNPHVIHIRNPELVKLHKHYFATLWNA